MSKATQRIKASLQGEPRPCLSPAGVAFEVPQARGQQGSGGSPRSGAIGDRAQRVSCHRRSPPPSFPLPLETLPALSGQDPGTGGRGELLDTIPSDPLQERTEGPEPTRPPPGRTARQRQSSAADPVRDPGPRILVPRLPSPSSSPTAAPTPWGRKSCALTLSARQHVGNAALTRPDQARAWRAESFRAAALE